METDATIRVFEDYQYLRRQAEELAKACGARDEFGAAAFLVWWLLGPDQNSDDDEFNYRQNLELIKRVQDGAEKFKKSLSYADGYHRGLGDGMYRERIKAK